MNERTSLSIETFITHITDVTIKKKCVLRVLVLKCIIHTNHKLHYYFASKVFHS